LFFQKIETNLITKVINKKKNKKMASTDIEMKNKHVISIRFIHREDDGNYIPHGMISLTAEEFIYAFKNILYIKEHTSKSLFNKLISEKYNQVGGAPGAPFEDSDEDDDDLDEDDFELDDDGIPYIEILDVTQQYARFSEVIFGVMRIALTLDKNPIEELKQYKDPIDYFDKEPNEKLKEFIYKKCVYVSKKSKFYDERTTDKVSIYEMLKFGHTYLCYDGFGKFVDWVMFKELSNRTPKDFHDFMGLEYNPMDYGFKTEDEHIDAILNGYDEEHEDSGGAKGAHATA